MRRRLAWSILPLLCACAGQVDFRDPQYRPNRRTAFTLDDYDTQVTGGLVGVDVDEIGASLGLRQNIAGHLDLNANLAHLALGLVSLGVKVNVIDDGTWGLGVSSSVLFGRAKNVWVLGSETREAARDAEFLQVPVRLTGSYATGEFVLSTALGYRHGDASGTINTTSRLVQGVLASREVFAESSIYWYLQDQYALFAYLHIPLYSRALVDGSARQVIARGIAVGGTQAIWESGDFADLVQGAAGVSYWLESERRMALRFSLARTPLDTIGIGFVIMPTFDFSWRL